MNDEYIDIVDQNDRVIARATRREVHVSGHSHRAVHVWIFDRYGRILLQKRSLSKDSHPGAWDCSCSGHVNSGENYGDAAIRELAEELGIRTTCKELKLMKYLKASVLTEHEFISLFRLEYEGPLFPNPSEICEIRWWWPSDVITAIRQGTEKFTIAFPYIANKYLLT